MPLVNQTAEEVVKTFVEHAVLTYGIPQVIFSDCVSQFLSEYFKGVCKLLVLKILTLYGAASTDRVVVDPNTR